MNNKKKRRNIPIPKPTQKPFFFSLMTFQTKKNKIYNYQYKKSNNGIDRPAKCLFLKSKAKIAIISPIIQVLAKKS
jgi:hypothetical protein